MLTAAAISPSPGFAHAHDLTGRLRQLGIPLNFQAIVINAIETGTVPPGSQANNAVGAADQEFPPTASVSAHQTN